MNNYIVFDIETEGLRSIEGNRITCICAKDNEGGWFTHAGDVEKETIYLFLEWLSEKEFNTLVSANGKDFDVPFLLIRAYLNSIHNSLGLQVLRGNHFDIINDITDKKISVNNMARLYGFEQKSGDGLKAIRLAKEKKWDELIEYCCDDVKLEEKIYLKYNEVKK